MDNLLWIEKYRPKNFKDILGQDKIINLLEVMIKNGSFPHLILSGISGTGKTSTIMTIADKLYGSNKTFMVMKLDASDDRGINSVREEIKGFAEKISIFNEGIKLIILDEADSMTFDAQFALRRIIEKYSDSTRFCLICNYITRIDESLQNEFMRLRFNQLPQNLIIKFLTKICLAENITLSEETLLSIQQLYRSDIRSMINYMQSNQDLSTHAKVIDEDVWKKLTDTVLGHNVNSSLELLDTISDEYNIDAKSVIKDYLNYIIRHRPEFLTEAFLKFAEFVMHSGDPNVSHLRSYVILCLQGLLAGVSTA